MILEFSAENYRCLKSVTVKLTPLHAFIGPNDSGKSTLLEAIKFLVDSANRPIDLNTWAGGGTTGSLSLRVKVPPNQGYELRRDEGFWKDSAQDNNYRGRTPGYHIPERPELGKHLLSARLLRLDPDDLRRPAPLIPEGQPLTFSTRGGALPAVYDAILSRGDNSYFQIQDEVKRLFPTVAHLRLRATNQFQKAFEIELKTGERAGAEQMSEGLLYYLAFAALPHLEPTSVVLVEEPENGLHPSWIADVMRTLREVSKTTQVLLATHSPLVVNELRPDEVTLVTRTLDEGTRLTPIQDTPRFEERAKVYALGELWLSYANGTDEAPLLTGAAP
ncbi:MAG: hypothetical protein EXR72_16535 [Myxococcales bacterium]|nr:hypothetical protein [Myxococcales bacterium]